MASAKSWSFTVEPGYFVPFQDLQDASPIGRVTTQPLFGLIPREYPTDHQQSSSSSSTTTSSSSSSSQDSRPWARFAQHVASLNSASPPSVSYKVLYLTRHGFGFHNKKEKEVGTPEWDRYWSFLDGADGETWFDSFLTPEGIQQARDLSALWLTTVNHDGAPLPSTLYTSPLSRCLQTCHYSLSPLLASHDIPFTPVVREKLRERMTMHTCDKRRPRSWIHQQWPHYEIGDDVTEDDVLGSLGREETYDEHVARKQLELQELFDMDQGHFLSLTTHSQAIASLMMACGENPPRLREGTTLAILVRGERLASH